MVSFNVYRATSSGAYIEGVCLASDEKPIVGISNGSILYAVDASDGTTTRYMFDQSTASWIEAECPGGGGSGSGGGEGGGAAEPLVVSLVREDPESPTDPTGVDVCFNDVKDALEAGKSIYIYDYKESSGDVVYLPLVCLAARDGMYIAEFGAGAPSGYGQYEAMAFTARSASTNFSLVH